MLAMVSVWNVRILCVHTPFSALPRHNSLRTLLDFFHCTCFLPFNVDTVIAALNKLEAVLWRIQPQSLQQRPGLPEACDDCMPLCKQFLYSCAQVIPSYFFVCKWFEGCMSEKNFTRVFFIFFIHSQNKLFPKVVHYRRLRSCGT